MRFRSLALVTPLSELQSASSLSLRSASCPCTSFVISMLCRPRLAAAPSSIGNFDGVHRGHIAIVRRLLRASRRTCRRGDRVHVRSAPGAAAAARAMPAAAHVDRAQGRAARRARRRLDRRLSDRRSAAATFGRAISFSGSSATRWQPARWWRAQTFTSATIARAPSSGSRQLTAAAGISLDVVSPVEIDGEIVSSSRVRELIRAGNVEQARRAARRAVSHSRHGHARRRPRREDRLSHRQPRRHRYAAAGPRRVRGPRPGVGHGPRWPAAINLGPSPTFGDATIRVEVHMIGSTNRSTASRWRLTSWPACGTFGHLIRRSAGRAIDARRGK